MCTTRIGDSEGPSLWSQLDRDEARNAPVEQIPALVHEHREEILRGLLENPVFEELHLCLLLGRADLSTLLPGEIACHKQWMGSYRVKRGLAFQQERASRAYNAVCLGD